MKAIVAWLVIALFAAFSTGAFAAGPFGSVEDVVVVYCQRSDGVTGNVFVSHTSSSAGASTVPVGLGISCAEELKNLTRAKFRIQSVIAADGSFIVYTLTRR